MTGLLTDLLQHSFLNQNKGNKMNRINVNKQEALVQMENLIKSDIITSIKHMPNRFNEEQAKMLEQFQNRLYFEQVIEETISFNKKLNWDNGRFQNIQLTTTAEELIKVFALRSEVYGSLNYGNEFPDIIEGLNFDDYDHRSAIVYTKTNNEINATCRFIFKNEQTLPIEEKLSLSQIKDRFQNLGEVSRLIVKKEQKGLGLDFKALTTGIYFVLSQNNLDASISVIKKDHFKLYSKFGGFNLEYELDGYGHLGGKFVIVSWNYKEISKFFQKAFL